MHRLLVSGIGIQMLSPENRGKGTALTTDDTSGKSWRTGCGDLVASLVFFIVVTGLVALRPVREAKRVEQNLNDRFGEVPAFSPAPDGLVAPDRIEVFISVRHNLREPCRRFRENRDRFDEIDKLEQEGELSSEDVFGGLKTAFGFLPDFLNLMRSRNGALLEAGMGLGEYSYIYVLAYSDQLSSLFNEPGQENLFKPRTRRELTQILRNQHAALEAQRHEGEYEELSLTVREEIAALEKGSHAFPWQGGLPPFIETSFAPYEDQLDDLFCDASVRFELQQKNKNPGGIGE